MISKSITLVLAIFLLASCTGYKSSCSCTKKSDKNVETYDLDHKRLPLYNNHYILKAKKNILTNNLDEDEIDDTDNQDEIDSMYAEPDPAKENIEMYRAMITQDMQRKNKHYHIQNRNQKNHNKKLYSNVEQNTDDNDFNTRAELYKIKSVLDNIKKDMGSRKCFSSKKEEKEHDRQSENQSLPDKTKPDTTSHDNQVSHKQIDHMMDDDHLDDNTKANQAG